MLFISADDFFAKASTCSRLPREEEKALVLQMAAGDKNARMALICSYLPFVASRIRRSPRHLHTLSTVYTCIDSLEKAVDCFNFSQDSEPFLHHLSWRMRQCITKCIALY